MKLFVLFASFGFFAFLLSLTEPQIKPEAEKFVIPDSVADSSTINQNTFRISEYNFDVDFDDLHKSLFVKQRIVWFNNSEDTLTEIQFNVFPSAYTTNESEFLSPNNLSLSELGKFELKTFFVDGFPSKLKFSEGSLYSNNLSSSGEVSLLSKLLPGDSVNISMEYYFKFPRSTARCGYARGMEFFLAMDWYPEIAPYYDGGWHIIELHPFSGKDSSPMNVTAEITLPDSFALVTGGVFLGTQIGERKIYHCDLESVRNFVWAAFPEKALTKKLLSINDRVSVQLFLHPEKEYKEKRIVDALTNSINFLKQNLEESSLGQFSIIELPKSISTREAGFKDLAFIRTSVIDADKDFSLERQIATAVTGYFVAKNIFSDDYRNAWIQGGFTRYLSEKVIESEYQGGLNSFNYATFYPIYGVDYLFYREIPVMYSLSQVNKSAFGDDLLSFYSNRFSGEVAKNSNLYVDEAAFSANTFSKPALIWKYYENMTGECSVFELIDSIQAQKHTKRVNEAELFELLPKSFPVRKLFFSGADFDYRVVEVARHSDSLYRVSVQRIGEGIAETEVALYLQNDTLYRSWDGREISREFYFSSTDTAIAAEVDPFHKNILDINYSNNSFTVENQYKTRISLSVRWFFWIQNALMVLGSIG